MIFLIRVPFLKGSIVNPGEVEHVALALENLAGLIRAVKGLSCSEMMIGQSGEIVAAGMLYPDSREEQVIELYQPNVSDLRRELETVRRERDALAEQIMASAKGSAEDKPKESEKKS